MNNLVQTRVKEQPALAANYVLPMLLAGNTFALVALNQIGLIPSWLKAAVSLFLAF